MEQRFAPALRTLQKLLQQTSLVLHVPISFALIGGLATSAWGAVRATEAIDLLADSSPSPLKNRQLRVDIQSFLEKRGCSVEWRIGEADDPIPLLLRLQLPRPLNALAADILWAQKRWQREALARRIIVKISRLRIFVLHPEDLILMKLEAGGPQDLLDVQSLLSDPPHELDRKRFKRKAAQLHLSVTLGRCMRQAGRNKDV